MSKEEKRVPEVRFEGFYDDWKQRKLGDISEKVTEKNKDKKFTETFTNSAEYGIVPQNDFFDKVISNSKNISNYYIVQNDDFIYNPRISNFAPVGPIKRNKLNKVGVMSPLYYVFRTKNIDLTFLEKFFDTSYWHRFMKLNGDTGARADRFAIKDSVFKEMPVPYPSSDEQTKIGNLLKQIDRTIALHQRKLEQLRELKKAALQYLFPQQDKKEPKVRFTSFNEIWEQRKLNEVSEKVRRKNKNKKFTETFTNSAEYGIISQNEFFDKKISNAKNIGNYYIVHQDDFVYNPRISFFAPVGPIKRNNLNRSGIMSPLYYVFRPKNIDLTFLEKFFDTNYWYKFMKLNGDTGARADRFSIKDSVFEEMPIPYPDEQEQFKIGNLLKRLDEINDLNQQKLEELQNFKKAFLQKMFI